MVEWPVPAGVSESEIGTDAAPNPIFPTLKKMMTEDGLGPMRIIFWDEWIDRTNLIHGSEGFVGSGSNIIQNDITR